MNYKQANLRFILRTNKKRKTGKAPVYLRITVDEKRAEISTKRNIEPSRWDSRAQQVKGNKPDATSINNELEQLKHKAYQARQELITEDSEVTAQSIKARLKGDDIEKKTILEVFEEHNDDMKSKAERGKKFTLSTYKRYRTTLKHVKSFLENQIGDPEYLISNLDYKFLEKFEDYLRNKEDECSHNTAMKYISHLKKVINIALKESWLEKDPFHDFDHGYKDREITFLTEDELKRIENKDFSTESLSRVRDVFVFSCYTGLSYCDAKKLSSSHVKEKEDEVHIHINRKKTGELCRIMLLPKPLEIIQRYKNSPKRDKDKLLPMISNPKTNEYLKTIADVCEVDEDKNITHHVARHTFATMAVNNGMKTETLQKVLGHARLSSTRKYYKILDKTIEEDMQLFRGRLGS